MKNFQGFPIALVKSLLILSVVYSITACGSDGSSSDDPENEIPADSLSSNGASSSSQIDTSLSYSEYRGSNGITKDFESPLAGATKIVFDSITDSRDNQIYPTLRIGPYIWMAKNLNYASSDFESYCYGGNAANCKIYGRLYKSGTENVCPEGFYEPEYGAWQYLKMFIGSFAGIYSESYWKKGDVECKDLVGFGALPGGSCQKADNLKCFGLTEETSFLSGTNYLFTSYQSPSGSYLPAKTDAYYSLRCVKPFPIVNSISELPVCDGTTGIWKIFVRETGFVYWCYNSAWHKDTNDVTVLSCSSAESLLPVAIDSSVYVCKNDHWQLATAGDAGVKCTVEDDLTIMKINGVKYVCDDSTWRLPTTLENEFGLCDKSKLKQLDSTSDTSYYVCDTSGWRTATIDDYAGDCDTKNNLDSVVRFGSYLYACKEIGWEMLIGTEEEFGLCRANNRGILDTAETGMVYVCGATDAWALASATDCYGTCDATKQGKTYEVNGSTYLCDTGKWRETNKLDDSLGLCLAKNKDSTKIFQSDLYICSSSGWIVATKASILGTCSADSIGKLGTYMNDNFVCKKTGWTALTDLDVKFGPCAVDSFGLVKTKDTTHYICDTTGIWRETKGLESVAGLCRSFDTTIAMGSDSIYYKCTRYSWSTSTINEAFGSCTEASSVKTRIFNKQEYVCDPSILGSIRWHLLSAMDSANGYCKESLNGKTVVYNDMSYICGKTGYPTEMKWELATSAEYLGTCNASVAGTKKIYNQLTYLCSDNEWSLQLNTITDLRDNEVYKITIIGDQTWMAEDLRYGKADSSWCNSKDNCNSRIYSWSAAMALNPSYDKASASGIIATPHQGACPAGFHIPSMSEWNELRAYFKNYGTSSCKAEDCDAYYLKDKTAWGTTYSFEDMFGFGLKPATTRTYFQNTGDPTYYYRFNDPNTYTMWLLDEDSETNAKSLLVEKGQSYSRANTSSFYSGPKTNAYSVRCLKN